MSDTVAIWLDMVLLQYSLRCYILKIDLFKKKIAMIGDLLMTFRNNSMIVVFNCELEQRWTTSSL